MLGTASGQLILESLVFLNQLGNSDNAVPLIFVMAVLMIACPTLFRAFVFIFDRQMRKRDNKTAKK